MDVHTQVVHGDLKCANVLLGLKDGLSADDSSSAASLSTLAGVMTTTSALKGEGASSSNKHSTGSARASAGKGVFESEVGGLLGCSLLMHGGLCFSCCSGAPPCRLFGSVRRPDGAPHPLLILCLMRHIALIPCLHPDVISNG